MWGAISQNIIELDLELVTGMGRERKRGATEDMHKAECNNIKKQLETL